jgi:hypothetical protein
MAAGVFAAVGLCAAARAVEVGSDAPDFEPSQWLNAKGNVSWKTLKGRVILLEKWATW